MQGVRISQRTLDDRRCLLPKEWNKEEANHAYDDKEAKPGPKAVKNFFVFFV